MTTAARNWEQETLRLETLAAVDNVVIAWLRHEAATPPVKDFTREILDAARQNLNRVEPDMGEQMDDAINHHEYGGPVGYRARCYNDPGSIGESWLAGE